MLPSGWVKLPARRGFGTSHFNTRLLPCRRLRPESVKLGKM